MPKANMFFCRKACNQFGRSVFFLFSTIHVFIYIYIYPGLSLQKCTLSVHGTVPTARSRLQLLRQFLALLPQGVQPGLEHLGGAAGRESGSTGAIHAPGLMPGKHPKHNTLARTTRKHANEDTRKAAHTQKHIIVCTPGRPQLM